jgi:hypothetical protein
MPTYPQDFATMRQALYDWVSGDLGVGWTVVHEPQDGDGRRRPAPAKPFAKIHVLDAPQPEGRQFLQMEDASPTELNAHVRNVGLMRVEVQLFSDTDQRAAAENLRASLDLRYPTLDSFFVAGLTVVPSEVSLRDLSEIFSGEREYRYALEIGFRVETRRTVTYYPWIETAQPLAVEVN